MYLNISAGYTCTARRGWGGQKITKNTFPSHSITFIPPMQFTQIPSDYAPLDGGVVYAFEAAQSGTHNFRIIDVMSGDELGVKRFYATAKGRFDATPYLRDRIRFIPAAGSTGFAGADGRSVTIRVETEGAATPARTFLPGRTAGRSLEIRTSLPRIRLLGRGECEEITLLGDEPCTATILVRNGDAVESVTYRDTAGGLRLFRLDTADFPQAETITLRFGEAGEVEYRIVERPREAHRLAWAGQAGSIEHYTFPIEQLCEVRVAKERICGREGPATVRCEREVRTTLVSAFETPEMAEALTDILSAPAVWQAEDNGSYTPVDVLSDRVAFRRHGAFSCLEITIR